MPGLFMRIPGVQSFENSIGTLQYEAPFADWTHWSFLGGDEAKSIRNYGSGGDLSAVGTPVYNEFSCDLGGGNYFSMGVTDPIEATLAVIAKPSAAGFTGFISSLVAGNAGLGIHMTSDAKWRVSAQFGATWVNSPMSLAATEFDRFELILVTVSNGPPRRASVYWPRLGLAHSASTPGEDRIAGVNNLRVGQAPATYNAACEVAFAGLATSAVTEADAYNIYEHLRGMMSGRVPID